MNPHYYNRYVFSIYVHSVRPEINSLGKWRVWHTDRLGYVLMYPHHTSLLTVQQFLGNAAGTAKQNHRS